MSLPPKKTEIQVQIYALNFWNGVNKKENAKNAQTISGFSMHETEFPLDIIYCMSMQML